ncbi:YciI family protein [Pseudomonas sp. R5(2019)]|uniref:YciI family protein n=1 Tax=Pseudomonas sp. R5(2019) TaxID=2697566 RepID=UPI0014129970|nr:YciI family protein [Pseudomonas sp. R5(2019)]NBA98597.1 YciI family protein [Pseudomonas sp. R5(2019)]
MRCMVIVKATRDSETGVMPSQALLTAMGQYNEELVKAGIMQAGEGLHPTGKGVRVRFDGTAREVVPGPFTPTDQQIAGFWLFKVDSLEHAIEWVKRCPPPFESACEIEIRPVFEAEDFGEEFTPELREQEDRLRAQMADKNE